MWHAKRHSGFGITGLPGTFCVADLSTSDQDGASRFCEQLFKWRIGKERKIPPTTTIIFSITMGSLGEFCL